MSPLPPARGSGVWGSAVSSLSGVRGGTPENFEFNAFWDLKIALRQCKMMVFARVFLMNVTSSQQPKVQGGQGGSQSTPLNTLVGMTRGVGYFVKEVEPPQPSPHKYSPDNYIFYRMGMTQEELQPIV